MKKFGEKVWPPKEKKRKFREMKKKIVALVINLEYGAGIECLRC